ncbi:MAG TPA: permease-like cell division protein FtsX [Chitinophagales bacterium]|nr:permease-like cell division protein FtsX [Chitinophagales bacterium]
MSTQAGKSLQKKQTHYINAILITALALLMLGIMSVLFLSFKYEEANIKEDLVISAYLKEGLTQPDIDKLLKRIENNESVKSIRFISKEEAMDIFKSKFNEDPSEILEDVNPLPASMDISLEAAAVNVDSISAFREKLQLYPEITHTRANEALISSVDTDLKVAGFIIAGISILFLVIAIAIIDKTIRLSMYSNRFLVRSMQLVGATRGFITAPYVKRSIVNGIISAAIALVVLFSAVLYIHGNYAYWDFSDPTIKRGFIFTALMLFGVGILITWFSTRSSVHKYIKMKLDELY